jgi:hypothetical protein
LYSDKITINVDEHLDTEWSSHSPVHGTGGVLLSRWDGRYWFTKLRYVFKPGLNIELNVFYYNGTFIDRVCGNFTSPLINPPTPNTGPWAVARDQVIEQDRPSGAPVPLDASGSGDPDGDGLLCTWWEAGQCICGPTTNLHASAIRQLGRHAVTLVVDDGHDHTATANAVLTVVDTTPPVLTVPKDIAVEQATRAGKVVNFAVTAEDICDANPQIVCTPPSGTEFPLGDTEVTCTATDASGNSPAPRKFTVHVVDTTPPVLTVPGDITVEQATKAGTCAKFRVAAEDICDANPQIVCTSPSGTEFPLGDTEVTCTATDASGNVSAPGKFTVHVIDTTVPVLTLPDDITVEQAASEGSVVKFKVTAADICDANPHIVCTPPSGTEFALGTTEVNCTATDASGNSSAGKFRVIVKDTTPANVSLSVAQSLLWPPNHDLVDVGMALPVADICDAHPVVQISVTQDEPVEDQTGDGNFSPDAKLTRNADGSFRLRLRSECKGDADGRVYLIIATVTDASGNTTVTRATVVVPHSQSKADRASVAAQAAAALAGGVPLAYNSLVGSQIGPKQ